MKNPISRRSLLRHSGMGAAAVLAATIAPRRGRAADLPRLDVHDPAAAALGYVEDAATVDTKKYSSFSPGASCANCMQLQGKAGEAYRPCAVFPGKLVAAAGWCMSWTPEM